MTAGTTAPTFTAFFSGLVNGDTATKLGITSSALNFTTTTGNIYSQNGSYKIAVVAGSPLLDNLANYTIYYSPVGGTLTINSAGKKH